jgi:8-oxo-dGTP pyrophosphatase MutT (NUDIX family)
MGANPSGKCLKPPPLPKVRQEVAAVCYRVRKRGVEFLLVQTRGGRWTFPKGGAEPGLTHAQSAAIEAVEEAGVHGRIEEIAFARYFRHRPETVTLTPEARHGGQPFELGLGVKAFLCEVSRIEAPQESNRNPTWFPAEKAKRRLMVNRVPEFGVELARVVDRASSRIQRLNNVARSRTDQTHLEGLRKVRFEAFEYERVADDFRKAALSGRFFRQLNARSTEVNEISVQAGLRRVLQIDKSKEIRPALRLGTGIRSSTGRNITAIDGKGGATMAKTGKRSSRKR